MKKVFALAVILGVFSFLPIRAQISEDHLMNVKCGTFSNLERRIDPKTRQIVKLSEDRPQRTHSHISPMNLFKIHYDIAGFDAVDITDNDGNGVPDYVDSVAYYFDFVYDIQVNQLGFRSPYPDNQKGGSGHYDVYLTDIGNGLYGETYYGECVAQDLVSSGNKFPTYSSYIILDNNYSPNDMTLYDDGKIVRTYNTTGINGMKISAAHEFHHAIQFKYGIPYSNQASVNEMVSVYMENRCFPESLDYLGYVRKLFRELSIQPFGKGEAKNGYAYGIYYHFLAGEFGEDIIRRQWELIGDGLKEYASIDSALKERGSSLEGSWNKFLSWVYHTGSRAIDGKYFAHASIFPELEFNHRAEIGKDEYFELSGQILPFEIRPIRYIVKKESIFDTPDTLDFMFSNSDKELVFAEAMFLSNYKLTYPVSQEQGKQICSKYYSITSNRSISDTTFCRIGYATIESEKPFPSPLRLSGDETIYLPAPENVLYNSKITAQIFSIDNVEVWSDESRVMVHNLKRVVPVNAKTAKLGSGVYLFRVTYGEVSTFGKFIVVQ